MADKWLVTCNTDPLNPAHVRINSKRSIINNQSADLPLPRSPGPLMSTPCFPGTLIPLLCPRYPPAFLSCLRVFVAKPFSSNLCVLCVPLWLYFSYLSVFVANPIICVNLRQSAKSVAEIHLTHNS